jgi:hypothetical protein
MSNMRILDHLKCVFSCVCVCVCVYVFLRVLRSIYHAKFILLCGRSLWECGVFRCILTFHTTLVWSYANRPKLLPL